MAKVDNAARFMDYIKTPLDLNSISEIYLSYGISPERTALFYDFVQSLMEIIFDTYLGDDVCSENDKINHFKWCWDKNIENFDKENIHFSHSNELYEYFIGFLMEIWYRANKCNLSHLNSNLRQIWNHLFTATQIKTRSDVDMFLEIYTLLTKSLVNKIFFKTPLILYKNRLY